MLFAAPVSQGEAPSSGTHLHDGKRGAISRDHFLPIGDIQLRMIGILGYAGLAPVVFLLVAQVLGRAEVNPRKENEASVPKRGCKPRPFFLITNHPPLVTSGHL